jgi:hypothetical protein
MQGNVPSGMESAAEKIEIDQGVQRAKESWSGPQLAIELIGG